MWTTRHSIESSATPEAVWARWESVDTWPEWDASLAWSRLDGAFAPGGRGRLRPRGAPACRFEIIGTEPGRSFADRTGLPLADMTFSHEVEPIPGGSRLTHSVTITGPLGSLFGRLLGRRIEAGLPEAMRRLADLAAARAVVGR